MFDNVLMDSTDEARTAPRKEPDAAYQKMEAGFNALFEQGGQEGIDAYNNVLDEQDSLGHSPSSVGLKDALHQEETDMLNLEKSNIMLDTSVDIGTRSTISQMDITDNRPETTLPHKLGREFLMQEDEAEGIPTTDERDSLRSLAIESLKNVTQYREAQQAIADSKDFDKTMTGLTMTADMVQLVIPFIEQANVAEALVKIGDAGGSLQSFLLMGEAKQEFFNAFKRMPLNERIGAAEKFLNVAHEANRTGFITNGILEKQMFDELIYGGAYTDVDRWVDDFVSIADLTILGKPLAWAVKAARAGKAVKAGAKLPVVLPEDLLSAKDMVRTKVSPVSPLRIASETNAEKTKAMYKMITEDTTDEAAQALSGSDKVDAVADAVLPEMGKDAGVRSKVHNVDAINQKEFLLDSDVKNAIDESNINALSRREMESAEAHVVYRMQEAVGVTSRTEMFQHVHTPTGAQISGVYGPANGGWADAEEALSLTEVALREHGLTREDMYILERSNDTGEYMRVDEPTGGDFLVGVDYNYRVQYSDVMTWDKHDVKHNFLDRIPLAAKFSVNRHFFDPASILDPHLTLGANAKVDKAARITKEFLAVGKKFATSYGKAGKDSQAKMFNYILEANEKQIPHNVNTLYGEYGFSGEEIETITSFREYWDTIWETRNITDVRALRNQGYGIYEDVKLQDRLITRPVIKGQVERGERIYDPVKGISMFMNEDDLVKLYAKGDTVSRLRRPQDLGGAVTDQMIVRNNNSWRGLRDSDRVYPHREGYFQRIYTSPHFIVEKGVTENGKEFEKAIATAETIADANLYVKRLQRTNTKGEYRVRGDVKNPKELANFEMDTFESNGLSSQRVRGDKLEDATAVVTGTENSNVLGPIDSIIATSRTMGNKVAMGDTIAAMKRRFMEQHAENLPVEKGMTKYPKDISEIGGKGRELSKSVADARSTYEYISFLEFGYINGMDSIIKGILKSIAESAGEGGLRSVESVFEKASTLNPTTFAKNLSFQMYLATNPFRQFALNVHQSTLLAATFTGYVTSQKLVADMHAFMYMRMGIDVPKAAIALTGRTKDELKFMWAEYKKSGLSASIDQNNLLRGALVDMAESQRYKGDFGPVASPLSLSRKVGFDFGEELNLNSAWLAHYDAAMKAKNYLDASDFDRISGQARNFTFNMNRAGDMPYNSNSLGLFMQYMQIPHKSLLQMTNRALSKESRARLFMYNAMMFTLPPAAMYEMFGGVLPDKEKYPDTHEAIVQGLEFFMFNKMLSVATGEEVDMNFGNLAPSDSYGLWHFIKGMLATDMGAMVASTPSGQLFFGNNPRITNLAKTVASIVNPNKDVREHPVTMARAWKDLASLSSGMSNYFKAKMALEYGKAYGARGQVVDPSVSTPEAVLMMFGFQTMASAQRAWVGMDMYKETNEYTKDVNEWYKRTTRGLASEGLTAEDSEYVIMVLSQCFLAFGSSTKAQSIIAKNLDRDAASGSSVIYDHIISKFEYMGGDKIIEWSNSLPADGTSRHQDLIDTINKVREYEENR